MTRLLHALLLASVLTLASESRAQAAPEMFVPDTGRGVPLVMVSGFSGVAQYREHAQRLAQAGYLVALIDGKDVLFRAGEAFDPAGQRRLRAVLSEAVADPRAAQKKALLVGFSLGGGGVLQWGVAMDDMVARAAVFYPVVSRPGQDMAKVAAEMRVPVLVFAAAQDTYMNCCLLQTMQRLQSEAARAAAPFEMVTYPEADHGFNLPGGKFRAADTADAWARLLRFIGER
jgi:dienelactone hydrolase